MDVEVGLRYNGGLESDTLAVEEVETESHRAFVSLHTTKGSFANGKELVGVNGVLAFD